MQEGLGRAVWPVSLEEDERGGEEDEAHDADGGPAHLPVRRRSGQATRRPAVQPPRLPPPRRPHKAPWGHLRAAEQTAPQARRGRRRRRERMVSRVRRRNRDQKPRRPS